MIGTTVPIILKKLDELEVICKVSANSFIMLVDDGSSDKTWAEIINLARLWPSRVRGIRLLRNFGHQYALLAGLKTVSTKSDACITIDADLQDDINAIEKMVDYFSAGEDVVLGVRKERKTDKIMKRLTAELYYKLLKKLGLNVTLNHADFRLLSKEKIELLCMYREANLYLRGVIHLISRNPVLVYYDRLSRKQGSSKYGMGRMITLALRGITSFSTAPLRLCTLVGLFVSSLSLAMMAYALIGWALGNTVVGWISIVGPLYLLGGLIIFFLGVIGEYIGNVYEEVKGRPRFLISEKIGDD